MVASNAALLQQLLPALIFPTNKREFQAAEDVFFGMSHQQSDRFAISPLKMTQSPS